MNYLHIKKNRDRLSKNFHPWVYSGALIENLELEPGEIVKVYDEDNKFIAYGFYNPFSKIALRLCEWNENKKIDVNWFKEKIEEAILYRNMLDIKEKTDSFRLIFSEADYLPGLIVDKFGEFLTIQVSTKGIERYINIIIDILVGLLKPQGIYLKIDEEMKEKEKLTLKDSIIYGKIPEEIEIEENEVKYLVNLIEGQKTGFFIDQRVNREKIRKYSKNKEVLDVFCYSGGFSLNSGKAGAKNITSIDSSKIALNILEKNFQLNKLPVPEIICGNAFEILRSLGKENKKFDLIILDPPKLSKKESDKEKALRAYKDLNMQALKIIKNSGILFSFSCSGNISREDLKKVIAWASIDSGRKVSIIENLFQSEDHPIRLSYPESEYLKGFVCYVY